MVSCLILVKLFHVYYSVVRIRFIKSTDHILTFITSCKVHRELRHTTVNTTHTLFGVNTTHTLFEDTETVSKRGDQMSVLYSFIDDVCSLIFHKGKQK